MTAVTGTVLLACNGNRIGAAEGTYDSAEVAGTAKISSFNPFGQESEYDVGENKGSAIFSGTGQYIEFGQDSSFAFGTGDFTVEWWHWATGNYWGTVLTHHQLGVYG